MAKNFDFDFPSVAGYKYVKFYSSDTVFWPTVRKNCPIDWEKACSNKFEKDCLQLCHYWVCPNVTNYVTTVESRFKKARFKKESRFKKDCCYNRFFST